MLDFLIAFFTDYGYAAVFGILILCGFGLPVPEDITLVSGGVISGLGFANPHTMVVVGMAGVLIGDSTMFILGRVFGYRIQRIRIFRRILSPRRFSQIQRKFKQYGLSLLFVARFLPGLRSPIFLVAGMSRRISYLTFIMMDGIAALISVPVWIYLGYFFADNLDQLMKYVGDVQKMIYLALGLLFAIILIVYLKKRFHHKLKAFTEDTETTAKTESKVGAAATAATAAAAVAATAATAATATAATSPDTAQSQPEAQQESVAQSSTVEVANEYTVNSSEQNMSESTAKDNVHESPKEDDDNATNETAINSTVQTVTENHEVKAKQE